MSTRTVDAVNIGLDYVGHDDDPLWIDAYVLELDGDAGSSIEFEEEEALTRFLLWIRANRPAAWQNAVEGEAPEPDPVVAGGGTGAVDEPDVEPETEPVTEPEKEDQTA